MKVAIIDYGLSNLHSVNAACKKVGLETEVTSKNKEILESDIAILPGVGAFGQAMDQIRKLKLDKCIYNFIDTGKPFVGICLGMQLLFDKSSEFGNHKGLGLVKGSVMKFKHPLGKEKFPIPQIGWNQIKKGENSWDKSPLRKNNKNDFFYFVHSYYVLPKDEKVILTTTNYCKINYCSSIQKENIFATQFHPEKSGEVGLQVYNQFKNKIG